MTVTMCFTQIGFSFTDLWGKSMAFYQRAYCYLRRKKSKSIVLFSCFLAISTLILCAAMILQTAESVNRSIREKTGSKIILDDRRGQNSISSETVSHLLSLPAVTKINRTASSTAYPADFSPIIKKESADPLNLSVTLHSCDNTEIDGLFAQEKYRLLEGTHITDAQNGILINSILAQANGLGIGDTITLETETGDTASGEIIGIFFSGMERRQEDNVAAAYRIENQLYVDHSMFETLFDADGYCSVSVYTSVPDSLDALREQAEPLVDDFVSITTSDALYQQMIAPLKQVTRVTVLMMALIVTTAVIVVSLLLCMWMRTRAKEMAVFISLGVSKGSLFLQAMTESLTLFVLSVLGATVICGLFARRLMDSLFSTGDLARMTGAHLEPTHLLTLILLGSAIVLIAVGMSVFPTLRANPRDTLTRMEG